jgi:hypothetical protein
MTAETICHGGKMAGYPFNERFWEESHRWPENTVGYVFLPRALAEIERLLGPAALPFPADLAAGADDAAAEAHEDAMEEYETKLIERRIDAADLLVGGCKRGELVSATRPKVGGKILDLDSSIWNTEQYRHWFVYGDLAPEQPYDDEDAEVFSERKHWLFISRNSLTAFTNSAPDVQRNRHLSPYMSLMISVIDALSISPQNQPPIKELEAIFAERASEFGIEKSGRTLYAMATLVRDPASQAGGNRKTKTKG